jgi:hypothetical protein
MLIKNNFFAMIVRGGWDRENCIGGLKVVDGG